jgi:SAM-dependent methyltransferase
MPRMKLDDPDVVRREFESETLFAARRPFYSAQARDVALSAVGEVSHERVLEIGCGWGDFAERIERDLQAEVVAVDLSPRMVDLARSRGIDARVADAQALPFPAEHFDCAVALWVLFLLPNLERGLAEIARVLRRGGRLVAVTDGYDHFAELWDLVGEDGRAALSFSRENGEVQLHRHFTRVVRCDVAETIVFADHEAARRYVASTITRRHLAGRLPKFEGSLAARCSTAVFVADKA